MMKSGEDESQGAENIPAQSLQATPEVPQERKLWKESQKKVGYREWVL